MRTAIVTGGARNLEQLQSYMPSNYTVSQHYIRPTNVSDGSDAGMKAGYVFVITGEDNAGWTLDDYVIPRLASGLIFATEVEG